VQVQSSAATRLAHDLVNVYGYKNRLAKRRGVWSLYARDVSSPYAHDDEWRDDFWLSRESDGVDISLRMRINRSTISAEQEKTDGA
jgi:hypothetical protein